MDFSIDYTECHRGSWIVHRRRNPALHREGGIVSRKSRLTGSATHVLAQTIAQNISLVRGHKVMLDMHLAALYGV
jgi:hypothetical protein